MWELCGDMLSKLISKPRKNVSNYYASKHIVKHYDADAFSVYNKSYDILMKFLEAEYKDELKYAQFNTLLELGCGTGNVLSRVLQGFQFKDVYGLDLSPEMLAVARKKVKNLHAICDSALNVDKHFKNEDVDLIIISFIFAYVDYRKLINYSFNVLKNDGILSIVTTTANSFAWLQNVSLKKPSLFAKVIFGIVNRLFKLDCQRVCSDFWEFMPQNMDQLTYTLQQNHYSILMKKELRFKVSIETWREAWQFMHNSGWFVGAIKQYKINKFKAFCLFYLAKACGLVSNTSGKFEDEMVVAVITAMKK